MAAKVLVVDDEEDIRESVKMLLESLGYEVKLAEDGMDCLEKISDQAPDLIIMDFFMPKMSGRETIKKIRGDDRYRDTKIVFLTVAEFQGDEFRKELGDLNISDYIQKPFDMDDFTKRVKEIVGEG